MSDAVREKSLQQFRMGEATVLVCTEAMEEGVDVPACNVVIRFNEFATTRSHIQGKGRARAANAKVYYFENSPDVETVKAAELAEVAQDSNMGLNDDERRRAGEHLSKVGHVASKHPFFHGDRRTKSVQINLYNCLNIFYVYVAAALQHDFDPEDLFTYPDEHAAGAPRKVLKDIRYPSDEGWRRVGVEDVNQYWETVDMTEVWHPPRSKRLKERDREKRRFVFVACVQLARSGCLSERNGPTEKVMREARYHCEALPPPRSGRGFRERFEPGCLDNGSSSAAA